MSLKNILVAAGIVMAAAAPAFAATAHNLRTDRAAYDAARANLHKDYVRHGHDLHALRVALHKHDKSAVAKYRHKLAADDAAIHRDRGPYYRARATLHKDYVALHHPVMHTTKKH